MIQVFDPQEWIIQIKSVYLFKRGKVVSICGNLVQILKSETPQVFLQQGPRQGSRIAGAKKVVNVLESNIKANSQKNVPGKVQFPNKWGGVRGGGGRVCITKEKPFSYAKEKLVLLKIQCIKHIYSFWNKLFIFDYEISRNS